MSKIDERLEAMCIDTSGMSDEKKFQAATGLTFYDEELAANDWYVPGGAGNIKSEDNNDDSEDDKEQTYTAEEAAAYNLTLDGAWQYGRVKTEAVEGVEGVHYTQEEIDAAQIGDDAYGKTVNDWKVEPVEAVEEELYTNEEVDAHNAELEGAVHAGDKKSSQVEIISDGD